MFVIFFLRTIFSGINLVVSSLVRFIPDNLEYPLYLISTQATKSQLEWGQLKFYKV